MKTTIWKNYDMLSLAAGKWMIDVLSTVSSPLMCIAAGNTPLGTFTHIVEFSRKGRLNNINADFISLDEWVGMNGLTNGSCRQTLDRYFFHPLKISEERIHFFDGKAADLFEECAKANRYIESRNSIDLLLLGIGLNGHIGFNEPGSPLDSVSRSVVDYPRD